MLHDFEGISTPVRGAEHDSGNTRPGPEEAGDMRSRRDHPDCTDSTSRRAFLKGSALCLASAATVALPLEERPALRLGLITDIHHADKPTSGTRHYRDSLAKVRESVATFNRHDIQVAVELGDIVDRAETVAVELAYLEQIEEEYAKISAERHYVLGNHCVDTLNKEQFLEHTGAEKTYYSFDRAGTHFVILDACFRRDGTPYGNRNFTWTDTAIPPRELRWLERDLQKNRRPTIVFAHQRLDTHDAHGVKNSPQVRRILEAHGQVQAVFQGHSHRNEIRWMRGIPYVTLQATIEGAGPANGACSILDLHADGRLVLEGFRQQVDRRLNPRARF